MIIFNLAYLTVKSVYIFLFIGNFYFFFVVSIFIIEWRDTELRSRMNKITGSQTMAGFLEIICKYCIGMYKKEDD